MSAPTSWGPVETEAISIEITRCVLGQAHHPELRTDVVGGITRLAQGLRSAIETYAVSVSVQQMTLTFYPRRDPAAPPLRFFEGGPVWDGRPKR